MKVQQINGKEPKFTVGRTFKNKQDLHQWIYFGNLKYNPAREQGKLNVLKEVFAK